MDKLEVHGITVQDQIRLGRGQAQPVKHLTFYVGDHGPFFKDFPAPDDTTANIQAYIQQTVADLRALTERQY